MKSKYRLNAIPKAIIKAIEYLVILNLSIFRPK